MSPKACVEKPRKRNNTQTSAIRKYFPINFENTEIIQNFVNHKIK